MFTLKLIKLILQISIQDGLIYIHKNTESGGHT